MEDNTLVKSSFSATIHTPIETWTFPLGALVCRNRNTSLARRLMFLLG